VQAPIPALQESSPGSISNIVKAKKGISGLPIRWIDDFFRNHPFILYPQNIKCIFLDSGE